MLHMALSNDVDSDISSVDSGIKRKISMRSCSSMMTILVQRPKWIISIEHNPNRYIEKPQYNTKQLQYAQYGGSLCFQLWVYILPQFQCDRNFLWIFLRITRQLCCKFQEIGCCWQQPNEYFYCRYLKYRIRSNRIRANERMNDCWNEWMNEWMTWCVTGWMNYFHKNKYALVFVLKWNKQFSYWKRASCIAGILTPFHWLFIVQTDVMFHSVQCK